MSAKTQLELAEKRAEVEVLEARAAAEDAVLAATTPAIRALAVELHTKECPDNHALLECRWFSEDSVAADDPERADWTAPFHARWLALTRGSLSAAAGIGWKLIPPGETQPLSLPSAR